MRPSKCSIYSSSSASFQPERYHRTANSCKGTHKTFTRSIHHPFFQPSARKQETIRIGVIGAGKNALERHIPGFLAQSGVEIVSVCNRTIESSERVAKQLGIWACRHYQEMLNDKNVDAVLIGTWPSMHKVLTLESLFHGKHVLCEARMAMNARQAHEMLNASKERPYLIAQLVPSPITLKYDITIQNLLKERTIGDIVAVDIIHRTNTFPDPSAPLHWRQDTRKSGFNTLTLGIWYEALCRWIGPATAVTGMAKVVTTQRVDPETDTLRAVQIPDHLDVLAQMACGAQARMQFSSVLGLSGSTSAAWLFGTKGTIKVDVEMGTLWTGRSGDSILTLTEINPEGKWRVEEEFVNCIRTLEKPTLTTFEDGVQYMEFTEAVWKSCAEKRTVSLPLVTLYP